MLADCLHHRSTRLQWSPDGRGNQRRAAMWRRKCRSCRSGKCRPVRVRRALSCAIQLRPDPPGHCPKQDLFSKENRDSMLAGFHLPPVARSKSCAWPCIEFQFGALATITCVQSSGRPAACPLPVIRESITSKRQEGRATNILKSKRAFYLFCPTDSALKKIGHFFPFADDRSRLCARPLVLQFIMSIRLRCYSEWQ